MPTFTMPRIIHSPPISRHEATGGTIGSPFLFQTLPEDVRATLRCGATIRNFADRQIIQLRGDPADGFWVIEAGQVKLGRYGTDGDMQVIAILGTGDSFGEPSCLGGFARVADAAAVGSTRLLWVAEGSFFAALDRSPGAMRAVLKTVSIQLQEALDRLLVVRKMPATQQIARAIATLCGARRGPVTLSLRQDELGELVGVSRITVGTALARLEAEGVLTRHYRKITVIDLGALRKMGRPNPRKTRA